MARRSSAQEARESECDLITLVDEYDRPVGTAGKLQAHVAGLLHRAFSIFLVDEQGRILLQRRHASKYHSGGLWANTCCGHPRPGEETAEAAQRRLSEELGISERLELTFSTRYTLRVSDDMIENEFVHVYFGALRQSPKPAPLEIESIALLSAPDLFACAASPQTAPWLRHYVTFYFAEIEGGISRAIKCSTAYN